MPSPPPHATHLCALFVLRTITYFGVLLNILNLNRFSTSGKINIIIWLPNNACMHAYIVLWCSQILWNTDNIIFTLLQILKINFPHEISCSMSMSNHSMLVLSYRRVYLYTICSIGAFPLIIYLSVSISFRNI